MILSLIILLGSLGVVLFGASKMTDGASTIALRMKISPMVVGLTVVAMGTSAPELFVSLMSALNGSSDLAVGNVVGSNIFNNLMIVGAVVLVAPQMVGRATVKRDIPFCVLGSVLLLAMVVPFGSESVGIISRWESALLFGIFGIFLWLTIRGAKNPEAREPETLESRDPEIPGARELESPESWNAETPEARNAETPEAQPGIPKALFLLLFGLACLIVGADYFVQAATDIARRLNVSDAVIGLTIVGAGTSLPEFAASVVAAKKGEGEMAIGNVIGSNVFNIFMILGLTGMVSPMSPSDITLSTYIVLIAAAMLFWLFSFTKYKLERWEGAVLLLGCVGYLAWLVCSI